MTVTDTLDRVPPLLARMAARDPKHRGRRLSLLEISERSGLSYGAVRRLSLKKTWTDVPPRIIDKFCYSGCDVDILHPKRIIQYVQRALKTPNGYKNLSAKKGHQSPRAIIKLLEELQQ